MRSIEKEVRLSPIVGYGVMTWREQRAIVMPNEQSVTGQ